MQRAIGLAVVLTLLSAAAAQAAWCGTATHDNAVVECGYETAADCQRSVGKDGYCFVDPDLARKVAKPAGKWQPQGRG